MQTCRDPLNTANHLVNIFSGHICVDEVNVCNAIDLGQIQMKNMKLAGQKYSIKPSKIVHTMKGC